MSGMYYYVVASLPTLAFGQAIPFSSDDFLADCQRMLSEKDFEILKKVTLDYDQPDDQSQSLTALSRINSQLRNQWVRARAKALDKDASEYIRRDSGIDREVVEAVEQAYHVAHPFEADQYLNRYRWQKYDEIAQGHFFDLNCLIVYALKLQILERYQRMTQEKGKEIFDQYERSDVFEHFLSADNATK
jgi:hypothetical protein